MLLRRILPAALCLLVAAATATSLAEAGTSAQPARLLRASSSTTNVSPLIDHGGKLLPSSTTYAIWWGSSGFPTDEQSAIPLLLQGFNGSTYLATANQYMRDSSAATTSYYNSKPLQDTSSPPSHGPSTATIVNEVAKVLTANQLTADPNGIYFVFTSNFPKVNYCAWHSSGSIGGTTVQVAYVPNTNGVTGCAPPGGYTTASNGLSQATQSIADSTAHEFMEAVTDPAPTSGWADKNGQEIADKCETFYGSPVIVGTTAWQLQGEWSNHAGGCVETTP